jgi:hypothetical protein
MTTPTFDIRENILILERELDRFDGRIETLDMADHEGDAGATGGGHDGAALLHSRRNRLLHHDVKTACNAGERNIVMQMGRRRDGHRLDAAVQQRLKIRKHRAVQSAADQFALLAIGIDDPRELNVGNFRKDARMVAAHDACADNANSQRTTPISPAGRLAGLPRFPIFPLACRKPVWRPKPDGT